MTQKILTTEQIQEAKELRIKDPKRWTKDKLAQRYGVGATTIWENIYATERRVKPYVKTRTCCYFCDKPITNHLRCKTCDILLHDDILEGEYTEEHCGADGLNYTARVHDECVKCYSHRNNIEFPKSDYRHTHEELSRLWGRSREYIASMEKKICKKIIKNPKFVKALKTTGHHERYTSLKIKHIEQILEAVPDEYGKEYKEGLLALLEEWKQDVE
jgi:hypothetical protein